MAFCYSVMPILSATASPLCFPAFPGDRGIFYAIKTTLPLTAFSPFDFETTSKIERRK